MHDPPPAPAEGSTALDRDNYFQTCLTCLATDVRMFDLKQYNLSKIYSALVGYQCGAEEGMPDTLCYECATKLNNIKGFRAKSRRAYSILRGLLDEYDEILETSVKEIDRKQNYLESALNFCNIKHIGIVPSVEVTISLKLEEPNPLGDDRKIFVEPPIYHNTENKDMVEGIDSKDKVRSVFKDEDDDGPMDTAESYIIDIPALKADNVPKTVKKPTKGKKKSTLIAGNGMKSDKEKTTKVEKSEEVKEVTKSKIEGESKVVKRKRKVKKEADSNTENEKVDEAPSLPAAKTKCNRRKPATKQYTKYTLEYYQSIAEVTVLTEEEQLEFFKRRGHTSKHKEALFSCDDCYLGFMYQQSYDAHMLKHDPSAGDKVCNICKVRFKTNRLMLKHTSMTHRTKYACRKCDFICSNSLGARQHAATHADTTYNCELCDVKFDQLSAYTSHMYVKHPKSLSCATCGVTFLGQGALNRHQARAHSDAEGTSDGGEVPCEQCGVVFRSEEACGVHRSTFPGHDSKNGMIGCEFCEEKFAEPTTLQDHRKAHQTRIGETKNLGGGLECEQCGEHLPTNRAYFDHFRQAHPDKTRTQYYKLGRKSECAIMCELCGKVFQNQLHYRDHKNTHLGVKPYKCDLCDKAFTSALMRAQHRRVHTKERPYACNMCTAQFSNRSNFRRHQKTVHTDATPFDCDICRKSFKYHRSLKNHIQFVHYKRQWPKRDRTQRKQTEEVLF